jgi:hypothetical protein
MANMDHAVSLCIEEEKQKCLEVIQTYYKKNKHPSILRLRDYLQKLSVHDQDQTVCEDLEKIKIYIATDEPFTIDEATHDASSTNV